MAQKRINKKIKKIVSNYLARLELDNISIDRVFIFGSQINGQARGDSDIDLAIVSRNLGNTMQSAKYLLRKAHEGDAETFYIEPHGFHPKEFIDENPFVWEIKKTGLQMK